MVRPKPLFCRVRRTVLLGLASARKKVVNPMVQRKSHLATARTPGAKHKRSRLIFTTRIMANLPTVGNKIRRHAHPISLRALFWDFMSFILRAQTIDRSPLFSARLTIGLATCRALGLAKAEARHAPRGGDPAALTDAPGKSILDHAQSNRITFFRTRRSTGWHGQGLEPTPRIRC
jgi:hypothetical protein